MSLMGDGYKKDTDPGSQVPERRFGNSGVVELICPRQHWYLLWTRRSKTQYDTVS